MTEYTSVKLPKSLADNIRKTAIEHGNFRSVSEYVVWLVRHEQAKQENTLRNSVIVE